MKENTSHVCAVLAIAATVGAFLGLAALLTTSAFYGLMAGLGIGTATFTIVTIVTFIIVGAVTYDDTTTTQPTRQRYAASVSCGLCTRELEVANGRLVCPNCKHAYVVTDRGVLEVVRTENGGLEIKAPDGARRT